ncbi:helix-turn-helix domain-containing protein [Nocardiopsis sp. MG754419]|uniref:winged helix-turn-helix transcriptional regulator n=1 Tax=Nocardiopsis sp. MG754419 TaxID=2259865 RepID=UPI001BAA9646|nr:helix-turn-helix domain-containing protein [Nocardiopsis sp. MG754419]MBR8740669.1 transcriptional regulator [Nocardiopsis sp. MG754419]
MPLRSDWSDKPCPIARGLDVLGDPWVLVILREVFTGNGRFDGLRDTLGIADTVLSRRLARMVEHGLLERRPYRDQGRTRREYVLTASGEDTLPVLHALARWGDAHAETSGPALRVHCTGCGGEPTSADWCVSCAQPLNRHNTAWRRPRSPDVLLPLAPGTAPTTASPAPGPAQGR